MPQRHQLQKCSQCRCIGTETENDYSKCVTNGRSVNLALDISSWQPQVCDLVPRPTVDEVKCFVLPSTNNRGPATHHDSIAIAASTNFNSRTDAGGGSLIMLSALSKLQGARSVNRWRSRGPSAIVGRVAEQTRLDPAATSATHARSRATHRAQD